MMHKTKIENEDGVALPLVILLIVIIGFILGTMAPIIYSSLSVTNNFSEILIAQVNNASGSEVAFEVLNDNNCVSLIDNQINDEKLKGIFYDIDYVWEQNCSIADSVRVIVHGYSSDPNGSESFKTYSRYFDYELDNNNVVLVESGPIN